MWRHSIGISEMFLKPPLKSIFLVLPNGVHRKLGCSFGTAINRSLGRTCLIHAFLINRFKLLLNEQDGVGDSESIIRTKALERGVLALPGTAFLPNGRKTAYVRAAFSLTGEEEVDEAIRRLRAVILEDRAAALAIV